jgi:hypothetical protein
MTDECYAAMILNCAASSEPAVRAKALDVCAA